MQVKPKSLDLGKNRRKWPKMASARGEKLKCKCFAGRRKYGFVREVIRVSGMRVVIEWRKGERVVLVPERNKWRNPFDKIS